MQAVILTKEPSIFDTACQKFGLAPVERPNGVIAAAENGRIGAYLCESVPDAVSEVCSNGRSERVHFAGFAEAVSTECRTGDVALPNAFFRMEAGVLESERTKEALAKFGKDALFLETYELQGDYDFGEFGLSVGGGCVSSDAGTDADSVSAMRAAYAADVSDRDAYAFVAAIPDSSDVAACVELAVSDPESPKPTADAERLVSIIAFLEESFSSDGEDEDGDEDEYDEEDDR